MILGAVHVIAALSCATLEVGAQGKEIHRDIERIRVSKINVDESDRDNHPSHRQTLEPGWVWLLRPVSEEPLVASDAYCAASSRSSAAMRSSICSCVVKRAFTMPMVSATSISFADVFIATRGRSPRLQVPARLRVS